VSLFSWLLSVGTRQQGADPLSFGFVSLLLSNTGNGIHHEKRDGREG
jgi:hypothetical protein